MNKLLKNIFILFTALQCFAAVAQPVENKIYSLPGYEGHEPKIYSIYQNTQGYILLGASDGLYRFDGMDFIRYKQPPQVTASITAICEINNEETWIGYENGTIGSLKYNQITILNLEEGFPKVAIKKIITDDKGIIWIATAGEGIYYYQNKKLYSVDTDDGLSDNYVYDIIYNTFSGVIAATDRGLNMVNLQNGKKIIKKFTSKDGLPDNIVRCLYNSTETSVWFGMQDAGIASASTGFEMYDHTADWTGGQVNDIVTTTSQVFVATEDDGLYVYEKDYNNRIVAAEGTNTSIKKISCLLRDREGNVWAAGDSKLMITAGSNIEFLYSLEKNIAEKIHCLISTKDKSIWFNSRHGVIKIARTHDGWDKKEYVIPGIANTDVSALYENENDIIWIGTMGKGIILLNPETGKQEAFKGDSLLRNGNIISITGKNNRIWIASLEGTFSVSSDSSDTHMVNYANQPEIGNKYIYDILDDSKGRTWFATDGNGIAMLNNGKFSIFDSVIQKTGNVVYRIVEDSYGNIWYSTFNHGLMKFDGKKFYSFSVQQGLSDLNITGLALSNDNLAAFHKNRIDIINTKNSSVSYLDEEQGLFNINTDLNAYSSDQEGNLYFIADTLLCRYHSSYNVSQLPKVMIDGMRLFLNDIQVGNNHQFRYDENNLSFFYTGLYYSAPAKIIYEYKLEGYNNDWSITKDKVQNFPQLSPGTYTFRVRASINNIFTSAPEASFTFTILKPFWQTAWFIILSIVLITSAVYFLIKEREKHFAKLGGLEKEKIRSQLETLKSQINPHFLFNSFNTLISEIEDNPSSAVTYVEKLSDFYRSIVSYREKDVIILEEELSLLSNYSFIQHKRFGDAFRIHINISEGQAKAFYITPLALQLLIENAVKHNVVSMENPLLIELFIDEEENLVIRNNIAKKMVQEKGSRMGLENIQRRYELLSSRTVVIEHDEKYFTVKIPLLKQSV